MRKPISFIASIMLFIVSMSTMACAQPVLPAKPQNRPVAPRIEDLITVGHIGGPVKASVVAGDYAYLGLQTDFAILNIAARSFTVTDQYIYVADHLGGVLILTWGDSNTQ